MTPTEILQQELGRFLNSADPDVLCITGAWGVGKTFTWQLALNQATKNKAVKLPRYSYVSLFGINSLQELKLAIFENTTFLLDSKSEGVIGRAKKAGSGLLGWAQKSTDLLGEAPVIGEFLKAAGPLFFSSVRSEIVCIDDLERRGVDLRIKDVLGLVTFLKEQRHCKVVLLLNNAELDPAGAADFYGYFEKVIDGHLKFQPLPEDFVRIALPGADDASRLIGANCKSLGIANIRIIKKIERFVRMIQPLLSDFDELVFHQAAHSLSLLAWSKYEPGLAPDLSYLKHYSAFFGMEKEDEDFPKQGAAWNALMSAYGFSGLDEFDLVLESRNRRRIF